MEDIEVSRKPELSKFLETCDQVFTYFFTFEMLLKWFGYGLKRYFSEGWSYLDFIIVTVNLLT